MRYKLFILILFFYSKDKLYAQVEEPIESPMQQENIDTEDKLKTKLGVKFALGSHTFKGSAFDNPKPLYGFGVGMYNIIDLNKSKRLKLHWEFNLTFKGSKFGKVNDTSFSKISISYLEIPVFLSFQLNKAKKPLHLIVGPQFSYMFKNSITQGYGAYGEVKANNLPFKKMDYSIALGFRKELGSGISVQFTSKYGLNNIYTNGFSTNPSYKGIYPQFKDGSHDVHNLSFELAFLF